MKPCIYGADSHPEGTVICVNGRGLKCLAGEWRETGQACDDDDDDGVVQFAPKAVVAPQPEVEAPGGAATKAKR